VEVDLTTKVLRYAFLTLFVTLLQCLVPHLLGLSTRCLVYWVCR